MLSITVAFAISFSIFVPINQKCPRKMCKVWGNNNFSRVIVQVFTVGFCWCCSLIFLAAHWENPHLWSNIPESHCMIISSFHLKDNISLNFVPACIPTKRVTVWDWPHLSTKELPLTTTRWRCQIILNKNGRRMSPSFFSSYADVILQIRCFSRISRGVFSHQWTSSHVKHNTE